MKKLLLSVLFILSISPLLAMVGTNVPIKADEIVIGGNSYVEDTITQSEYNRLNYSGLVAEFLRQGGTIDTTNINPDYGVDDVINEIGETIYEVIKDTGNFVDWLGDSIFQSEGTAYPENIKPRMNDKLSNNMWMFLGLAPLLNSLDSGTDIVPTPDTDYNYYIDLINGSGFNNIRNMPQRGPYYGHYIWEIYPPELNSYFKKTHGGGGTNNVAWISAPITTVNIIGEDNHYSLLYTFNTVNAWNNISGANSIVPTNNALLWTDGSVSVYDPVQPWTLTVEGTLEQVFTDLANNARNINIYVNGVLWSYVGGNTNNYTITLNPTTITPVDEHGRVRWKYDEEIYIDVDLMWQILDDFLNDPEQRLIRFSDIEDCIVDEDGQTAIAVKVVNDEDNVDEYYIKNYGTLIPVFPTDVSFPVSIDKMVSIVTVPVSVIPDDLMGVLKTLFIGTLMVCLLQRLLE